MAGRYVNGETLAYPITPDAKGSVGVPLFAARPGVTLI